MTREEKKWLYDRLTDFEDLIPLELFDRDGHEILLRWDFYSVFQSIVDRFGTEDDEKND